MRLQLADPADHPNIGLLPFAEDLENWSLASVHGVLGLHRHVLRLAGGVPGAGEGAGDDDGVVHGHGGLPPLVRE